MTIDNVKYDLKDVSVLTIEYNRKKATDLDFTEKYRSFKGMVFGTSSVGGAGGIVAHLPEPKDVLAFFAT